MLSYMQTLGITGKLLIGIVIVLASAELIKAGTTVLSFLAARFLGIRTRYTKKKEFEASVRKNREDLDTYIKNQETFNNNFQQDLDKIKNVVEDISDLVLNIRAEHMRNTILDFASAVGNGRIYTKEQFIYIKKVHRDYERMIEERGMTNDEVNISFKIIERAFEHSIINNLFIEDNLDDPDFQKELKDLKEGLKNPKEDN